MQILTCEGLVDSVCQNPSLLTVFDFSQSVSNVVIAMPVFVGFMVIAFIFRKSQKIIR